MLNTMLRDVFVTGLRSRSILDRILEEDDIPLEKTLDIARAMEVANGGTSQILHNEKVDKLNKLSYANKKNRRAKAKDQGNDPPKSNTSASSVKQLGKTFESGRRCFKCARTNHLSPQCKARNLNCTYCSKQGHVEEVCRKKASDKSQSSGIHQFKATDEDEIYPIKVLSFDSAECPPMIVTVHLNGKPVKMELDSGARASVISKNNFNQIPDNPTIRSTTVRFRDYDGNLIVPLGVSDVRVKFNQKEKNLQLYVLENDRDSLFGREWLHAFNMGISELNQLSMSRPEVIKLDDILHARPVFQKARTPPYSLKEAIETEIHRLVKIGVLKKVEHSEWASPVVPVVKSDQTVRLCGDYSGTVNPQILVPHYPFKGYDDVFSKLNGGEKFTTADVITAFLQLSADEQTQIILTLNTHLGLFQPTSIMYGVGCAPAFFQEFMDKKFGHLKNTCDVIDDLIMTGKDDEEHLQTIVEVLEICLQCNIRLNLKKCKFLQSQVKFLGYLVDKNGVHKTAEKISAIMDAPRPQNGDEIKSFLGMVGFYGKFFPNLATIAAPLNYLTGKNRHFEWTSECQESFEKIKQEIASDRVLFRYDPNLPLLLSVDASPVGLGAVLAHEVTGQERPIIFASRTLNRSERNYSQIDREALAIKWGIEKFAHYLYGAKFTLITDSEPLVHIFDRKRSLPKLTVTRLQHYALYLTMFNFKVKYRRSEDNGNADFLSRCPIGVIEANTTADTSNQSDLAEIFQLNQLDCFKLTSKEIGLATLNDPELKVIYEKLRYGESLGANDGKLSLQGRSIFHGIRVYIPQVHRNAVLDELHAGHLGIVRMKALARSHVYWPGIDHDIEALVKRCASCTAVSKDPKQVTHFWEYPSQPWARIHIDFLGPFYGHNFFILVDAYSKWPEVFKVPNITASTTIRILRSLFVRYGLPITIVSDNGPTFTSIEFKKFLQENGIHHVTTTPYHAKSNGQAERFVFTFKQAFRAQCDGKLSIEEKIDNFLLTYRRAPNSTTGETPAKLFMGHEIRTRLDFLRPTKGEKITGTQVPNFKVGDEVAFREYQNRESKWSDGVIVKQQGAVNYEIARTDADQAVNRDIVRRHADQIIPRSTPAENTPAQDENPSQVAAPKPEADSAADSELRRSSRSKKPVNRLDL
ncbi:uncharacterized protein K02A2.6-like [Planococcus citri]|uniref:uncharacterized protein K02A2.6-like n=1 Tax=Planococcus citri TaxID=170843 RepID=UPI0031F9E131